ncbi:SNF2-related protein [Micromonospora rubida]|uniref:SNF2-related protein n=1 Tax=Micromonospora rubida TaxID=2697657 RepID=UPI001378F73D|nr:DEAD/DEAH box helicase [Micromonospora rubida]NBE85336.1 ATP-dependent helicase [Micromonospora rubida]
MLVIHGAWLPGSGLAVWAEDTALPARAPRRPGRAPRERPHPFAADHATLAAALDPADPQTEGPPPAGPVTAAPVASGPPPAGPVTAAPVASGPPPAGPGTTGSGIGEAGAVLLRLPTRAGSPVDSPELVRTAVAEPVRGPVTLAGWRAPALRYAPADALALLCALGDHAGVPGASLRHLAELAEFAVDLVRRGRVLPGVAASRPEDHDPGAPATRADPVAFRPAAAPTRARRPARTGAVVARAVWRPLLTGADAAWARSLALALPPAARAAGDLPPGDLLADALDALTDAAARAALTRATPTRAGRSTGAVPAWLAALTGAAGEFTAEPAALAALRAELDDWQRDAAGGAVRASFRLVEPAADLLGDALTDPLDDVSADPLDDAPTGARGPQEAVAGPAGMPPDAARWRVEFGLQAADEPSLIVDAGQVWRSPHTVPALAGRLDSPQETLLAELGRASRLWPELDAALRTATPEALELDVEGAHRFLRDGAPVLHAAGFGVLLPGWWRRPSSRLGARLQARSRTAPGTVAAADGGFGLDALVDYRWEVALGDEPLTAEELAALAELKTPLVRLRGRWVELDPGQLAAGLRMLRSAGELTVADLLRLGLADADSDDALPVLEVTADGALGELLSGQAERRLTPLDPPPTFTGTLRPYQRRGLAWLAFLQSLGLGGVLADDMGLGKTVQLLALIAGDPPTAGPTLLVCPMSLVGNWQREAARFAPTLRVHVHHGADRARREGFAAVVHAADLVLTTYSVATRDAVELAGIDWHRLVVDEAQAIKNAATRQAEAVRSLPARHRVAVTGTPVENRLADLWSIMQFANPGLLGPAASFKKAYAEPIERHGDADAAERLRRMTGPFVLRRLKTDSSIISDLPEKLEMEVLCNLTAEQASLYQAVVDDMLARIESSDGIERRGLVLSAMTRLKQVCNHPAQLLRDGSALAGRSGKLARLEEILDEVLAAGERALLFTQYAEFGGMLRGHLSARFGREVLFLHGGVGKADRDAMVTRFQSADGPPLFVLSLKAGGTGLTLTAANHVVHVDRWWNPAVEDQATDRAFRIGQRRRVQVRKFVCAGTMEEKVAAMIAEKRSLAASVVGSGEQWVTELSTERLRELFTLDAGAVAE